MCVACADSSLHKVSWAPPQPTLHFPPSQYGVKYGQVQFAAAGGHAEFLHVGSATCGGQSAQVPV